MSTDHIKIPEVTPIMRYSANGSKTRFDFPFPIFADEDLKVYLLGALSRFGWNLKTLAKEGYGYNTASGGKWKDSAGKLNAKNKTGVWIYS